MDVLITQSGCWKHPGHCNFLVSIYWLIVIKDSKIFGIINVFHFEGFCKNADFIISEDAKEKLADTFDLLVDKKDESFGNARVVRNLFEKCVQNQANRIIKLPKISKKTLKTFTEEDIPEPKETQKQVSFSVDKE